ncbi:CBS domain-containing protein [Candidatus Micrarchaeota archaeon]|nr:CBS domain-containing protein [Candidatus Micrarchaeota archaeon]
MAVSDLMEETTVVEAGTDVAKAISLAAKEPNILHFAVVENNGAYAGMVDDRVLRDFTGEPSVKVGKLVAHPQTVEPSTSDEEVIAYFLNSDSKVLPVLKNKQVIGVVTRWGALKAVAASDVIKGKKVSDFMRRRVVNVNETTTIGQTRKLLKDTGVFRVVVLDEKGRMSGIVSTYDLAVKVSAHLAKNARQSTFEPTSLERVGSEPVRSIMTTDVATVNENDSLANAVRQMIDRRIMGLVVSKENKPIGMLAAKDVMTACLVQKPAPIQIMGLADEEKVMKQSLFDECNAFLQKLSKTIELSPEDVLTLHVKSNVEGKKKRFEVKSRLTVKGKVFSSRQPPNIDEHRQNWDLHLATRESLDELEKIVKKEAEFEWERNAARKSVKRGMHEH